MAAGEHVALQPALAVVLGEHLHDPAVGRVPGVDLGVERPLPGVVGRPRRPRRAGSTRPRPDTSMRKFASSSLRRKTSAIVLAELPSARCRRRPRRRTRRRRASPGRAALSGLRSLPPLTCGFAPMRRSPVGQACERSPAIGAPFSSNSSSGPVGAQPLLEDLEVLGVGLRLHRRHLVRLRRALDLDAVDLLGTGPALERAHDDHRPARPLRAARRRAHALLELADLAVGRVERLAPARRRGRSPSTISGCQP